MTLDPHSKCSCPISIPFHMLSSCLECLTFVSSHCLLLTLSIFSVEDFTKPSGISDGPTFAPLELMHIFLCIFSLPAVPWSVHTTLSPITMSLALYRWSDIVQTLKESVTNKSVSQNAGPTEMAMCRSFPAGVIYFLLYGAK